ncbi:hypothetical protein VW29_11445 [Devosia limi DSM 17137]|uniref:CheY chemotaxis protein or a CheY-like REC (Receiver) domain n=1 Tax=Devosia limi DSM 17137 TaxID=1121477 RepID=A0A0F5LPP8_9HYPH|nr:response regulator [Devosia limi]KKB84227.1 hypothetical protein VW29_11080 [Devosia limi DSM 17137]KKB84288.1 hypothetical protein VW29_11445 [Devosia limi DSM 17137]SHE83112.1 CheY chemotaxis protein or a CheY-like REC (receiver) domain [Devosia limi DSM 17137]
MPINKIALLVEEEFLIAMDLERVLEHFAITETVIARTAQEALALQTDWNAFALAIVDVGHAPHAGLELAHHLLSTGVPLVLTTTDLSLAGGIPDLPNVPVVTKPVPETVLVGALQRALSVISE